LTTSTELRKKGQQNGPIQRGMNQTHENVKGKDSDDREGWEKLPWRGGGEKPTGKKVSGEATGNAGKKQAS